MKKTLSVLLVLIISLTCVFAVEGTWSKNNVSFTYAPWVYKDVNAIGDKTHGESNYNSKYGFAFGLGYEYKFNQYLGLEFVMDFTDVLMIDETFFPEGTYTQSLDYLVKVVGNLPVSKSFTMFGKLGLGGISNFATNKDSKKSSATTFLLATVDLGGVYHINKNWGIGASVDFEIESKQEASEFIKDTKYDAMIAWYTGAKLLCTYSF